MISLSNIIELMKVEKIVGAKTKRIKGLAVDSRKVRDGFVFFAAPGTKDDGIFYVQEAVKAGAAAVVLPASSSGLVKIKKGVTYIFTPHDVKQAESAAAARFYNNPSEKLLMAGVTGTNGKTTIAYLMHSIFGACGYNPGLVSTIEYRDRYRVIPSLMTTPDAIELNGLLASMVTCGCRACAMEVSSHSLTQYRVDDIHFDAAIFTNLTHDHLDYHKNIESYFAAKKRLFDLMERAEAVKKGIAVINVDDPWGKKLSKLVKVPCVTYGSGFRSSVRYSGYKATPKGAGFVVSVGGKKIEILTTLIGRHNAYNIMACVAASHGLGLPIDAVQAGIRKMVNVPGRLEKIYTGQPYDVYVDYAHTPDALKNALVTLREVTRGNLIVVFGCGGNRDRAKRPVMGKNAQAYADKIIVTSDNPRNEPPDAIIEDIIGGMSKNNGSVSVEPDREKAIYSALESARDGDVVLIAGKGHENYQITGSVSVPFKDSDVVRNFFVCCLDGNRM